jgi:hypothetical protein
MERRSLNDLAISRILQNDGGGKAVSPEEEGSLPSSHKTVTEGGVPDPEEIPAAKGFKMAATEPEEFPLTLSLDASPYTLAEALDGLFLSPEEFQEAIDQWRAKKNLILQSPPGVRKTYIAKRLAYYLMGSKDPERLKMIQFHQSYAHLGEIHMSTPFERMHQAQMSLEAAKQEAADAIAALKQQFSSFEISVNVHGTRLWPIMLRVKGHGSREREPLEEIACTLPLE